MRSSASRLIRGRALALFAVVYSVALSASLVLGGCSAGSESCGNGVLDPGEHCDGDCPTSCDEWVDDGCDIYELKGSPDQCDVRCSLVDVISECVSGDGCCPHECSRETDSDCEECSLGHHRCGDDCCPFDVSVVESDGDVGRMPSLAVDAAGGLHVSYFDATNGQIKYAYNDGTGWQKEVVAVVGNCGPSSLALDGAGQPWIAFHDCTDRSHLRLASREAGGFQVTIVDPTEVSSTPMVLRLDSQDAAHIVYANGEQLFHAYREGAIWQFETIPNVVVWDLDMPGFDLDAADQPHVAFTEIEEDWHLTYATREGGAWVFEDPVGEDPFDMLGEGDADLSVGPDGVVHIVWAGSQYAHDREDPWYAKITMLASSGQSQVEAAPDGLAWIAYTTGENTEIELLYLSGGDYEDVYQVTKVVEGSQFDPGLSLALDQNGDPAVAYFDLTNQELIVARF